MIYGFKLEDFWRNAIFVAGGHMTNAHMYASVLMCKTVHFSLVIASLNELSVKYRDVTNPYITVYVTKKIWTKLGLEFCADQGKSMIIVHALYRSKSSGAEFRKHLGDCMHGLDYKPCLAGPYLWLKAMIRTDHK